MKSVLISIQPKWCELIANGSKTIEVRKTKPKIETPFKCYIYCTQGDSLNYLKTHFFSNCTKLWVDNKAFGANVARANGKVIGEFVCDRIYDITPHFDTPTFPNQYICGWDYGKDFDCLSFEELTSYLNGKKGYGWHISDLVIYDKPRDLSEFARFCDGVDGKIGCRGCKYYYTESNESIGFYEECGCDNLRPLKRPPQSWCYVEEVRM